jgi:lysophospholipase L1-like esterase
MLTAAGLVAAALVAELALRATGFWYVSYHRPDPVLGLRLRAGAQGQYTTEGYAHVLVNSAGFRDRERALPKPSGALRIAVLGDSYIEGLQVELEKTFPALLERRLNECGAFGGRPIEVLNFGVSSYGTAQELLTFRHYASKYSPDLVLATVFTGNDIRNNSRDLEPDKMRPFFVQQAGALVLDSSFADSEEFRRRTSTLHEFFDTLRMLRVVQAAYFAKDRIEMASAARPSPSNAAPSEAGLDDAVFAEPKTPAWRDAWAVTEQIFERFNQEVRASGAKLIVVSLSSGIQVHPDAEVRKRFQSSNQLGDVFYADRRIESIANRLHIESIALAPELQRIAERDKVFLHGFANTRLGSGHWNEAGHSAAAALVADKLCHRAANPAS